MTYLEFYQLATNGGDLLKRIKVASVVWAINTADLPPETPDLEAKRALATAIFKDSDVVALKTLWFAIAGTGLPNNPDALTDTQIQNAVNDTLNDNANDALLLPSLGAILN